MIEGIISLIGSSAGGSISRIVYELFTTLLANGRDKRQKKHEQALASIHALKDYRALEDSGETIKTTHHGRLIFTLFGKDFGWTRESSRNAPHTPARSGWVGASMLLLVLTYCSAILACFGDADRVVWTFHPSPEPNRVGILFGLFSWSSSQVDVSQLTLGGVGFVLAHGLLYVISAWVTGIPFSRVK